MKKYAEGTTALVCCMLFIFCAHAQTPSIIWQKSFGGSLEDNLEFHQKTSDGGYILAGESRSSISGNKLEESQGIYDYWVIKTDSAGNMIWQNNIGGTDADFLWVAQETTDGGYILGGYSQSPASGDKNENEEGLSDYWIIKLTSSGIIAWQKTIGGSQNDYLRSLQQTTDGGYIIGGESYSPADSSKTVPSRGSSDYWIIKLNASGDTMWQKAFGGTGTEVLYTVLQTADGGYILGGYSNSSASLPDKTENSRGGNDYWIVKLNNNGVKEWDKTIGGNDEDRLASIDQTSDGGYILGGGSKSSNSGEKSENSYGEYDYWVVKTTATGDIAWQTTIGGSERDFLRSIKQIPDGNYILGGFSASDISGNKTENSKGFFDYWPIKLSSSGNIIWQKVIGGSYNDVILNVGIASNNSFTLAGYSESPLSGDKTDSSFGETDYWFVKISDATSSNMYEFTGSGNWNIAANWLNNAIPPAALPANAEIIINPTGNDECILNVAQTILPGGKITVMPGKKINVQGNLTIQQ